MHRRFPGSTLLIALTLALAVVACGDDDATDDLSSDAADESVADPDAGDPFEDPFESDTADDAGTDDDADGGEPIDEPAPEEDTGTITYAGETAELTTQDFGICETVNPAFADDYNIITKLADGTKFRLSGTLGEEPEDYNGLVIGDTFEEEQATDLDIARDGRTISGTANLSGGEIEFSFTC